MSSKTQSTTRRRRYSVVTVAEKKLEDDKRRSAEYVPKSNNNAESAKEALVPKPPDELRRNSSVRAFHQGLTVSVSVVSLKRHTSLESFKNEVTLRRREQHVTENMVHEEVESDVDKYYVRKKTVLGSGISGDVRTCVHKGTGRRFALKTLDKQNLTDQELLRLGEEIRIMAQLDHPNIVRLYESFETPTEIYLIMELLSGGDLFDRLTNEADHQLTETTACKLVQTILNAVRYLHEHNIVHRDLKLENFLFENDKPNSILKLIDFGFSQRIHPEDILTDSLGTAYYVAPEVLEKNYTAKCDIWSVGVITYMLLTGTPPFDGANDSEVLTAVRAGRVYFHPYLFDNISDLAKDFIRRCLTYDPKRRPSAEDAQRHPWFLTVQDRVQAPLSSELLTRMKAFRQKSALTRLCLEAVSYALTQEQITHLRSEFSKFDVDSTGTITFEGLKQVLENDGSLNHNEIAELFQGIDFEGTGRIHYHELIAAMMTKNHHKDETLKLAFDRMSHHKEYITYADIRDLLGKDYTDEEAEKMLSDMNFHLDAKINFSDFKDIMRGSQRVQLSFARQRRDSLSVPKYNGSTSPRFPSDGSRSPRKDNDGSRSPRRTDGTSSPRKNSAGLYKLSNLFPSTDSGEGLGTPRKRSVSISTPPARTASGTGTPVKTSTSIGTPVSDVTKAETPTQRRASGNLSPRRASGSMSPRSSNVGLSGALSPRRHNGGASPRSTFGSVSPRRDSEGKRINGVLWSTAPDVPPRLHVKGNSALNVFISSLRGYSEPTTKHIPKTTIVKQSASAVSRNGIPSLPHIDSHHHASGK